MDFKFRFNNSFGYLGKNLIYEEISISDYRNSYL